MKSYDVQFIYQTWSDLIKDAKKCLRQERLVANTLPGQNINISNNNIWIKLSIQLQASYWIITALVIIFQLGKKFFNPNWCNK